MSPLTDLAEVPSSGPVPDRSTVPEPGPAPYDGVMARLFLLLAGLSGFLAVGLGAFGAHGLERWLADSSDAERRLEWWTTAAHYHLTHALALGLAAWLAHQRAGAAAGVAGAGFALGTVVFSGSLYAMTLTGARWLGAITPIGGTMLLVGWAAVVVFALRMP